MKQETEVNLVIVGVDALLWENPVIGGEERAKWRAGEGVCKVDDVIEGFDVCSNFLSQ
jgi:hypothetical protein